MRRAAGDELDPDELMAWVAERVAPYKRIRAVELVDEIPKSAVRARSCAGCCATRRPRRRARRDLVGARPAACWARPSRRPDADPPCGSPPPPRAASAGPSSSASSSSTPSITTVAPCTRLFRRRWPTCAWPMSAPVRWLRSASAQRALGVPESGTRIARADLAGRAWLAAGGPDDRVLLHSSLRFRYLPVRPGPPRIEATPTRRDSVRPARTARARGPPSHRRGATRPGRDRRTQRPGATVSARRAVCVGAGGVADGSVAVRWTRAAAGERPPRARRQPQARPSASPPSAMLHRRAPGRGCRRGSGEGPPCSVPSPRTQLDPQPRRPRRGVARTLRSEPDGHARHGGRRRGGDGGGSRRRSRRHREAAGSRRCRRSRARSTARTATVCAPASEPAEGRGLVHAANAPPSRLHSKPRDVRVRAGEAHAGGRAGHVDAVDRGPRRDVVDVVADRDAARARGETVGSAAVSVARYWM